MYLCVLCDKEQEEQRLKRGKGNLKITCLQNKSKANNNRNSNIMNTQSHLPFTS